MSKDVLERRYYDGYGDSIEDMASPEVGDGPVRVTRLTRSIAQHIIDLKAEVSRLREAGKVELTVDDLAWVRRADERLASHSYDYYARLLKEMRAIIDRLCPPKAQPTDAELAATIEGIARRDMTKTAAVLNTVAQHLRARGGK